MIGDYNLSDSDALETSSSRAFPRPWRNLLLASGCLFLTAGLSTAQQMPTQAKNRALIVDGFSNHDWRKTTDFIKATLADTGMFEVEVTTTPGDSDDPAWGT